MTIRNERRMDAYPDEPSFNWLGAFIGLPESFACASWRVKAPLPDGPFPRAQEPVKRAAPCHRADSGDPGDDQKNDYDPEQSLNDEQPASLAVIALLQASDVPFRQVRAQLL